MCIGVDLSVSGLKIVVCGRLSGSTVTSNRVKLVILLYAWYH